MKDFVIKGPLPGEVLREARRSRGLSLQYIARELRLSVSVVDALENDDYQQLPATIFVQGYIRNYALLLGIDAEALLGQFNHMLTEQVETKLDASNCASSKASSQESVIPAKSLSYVAVVALVAIALFIMYQGESIDSDQDKIASKTNTSKSKSKRSNGKIDSKNFSVISSFDNKKGKQEIYPNISKKPQYDTLSIKFNKDSYVRVIDANNRQLLSHVGRRGFRDKVKGTAPFQIKIEKPENVEVLLNGKFYNHMGSVKNIKGKQAFIIHHQVEKNQIEKISKPKSSKSLRN